MPNPLQRNHLALGTVHNEDYVKLRRFIPKCSNGNGLATADSSRRHPVARRDGMGRRGWGERVPPATQNFPRV